MKGLTPVQQAALMSGKRRSPGACRVPPLPLRVAVAEAKHHLREALRASECDEILHEAGAALKILRLAKSRRRAP